MPVRPEFFSIPPRAAGAPPSLLVFGGSQGAAAINSAVIGALPSIRSAFPNIKIVHQTGERELAPTKAGYNTAGVTAEVSAFITDMPSAFAGADLIICRSGASTVAEITAAGKPAIFIPFPRAADDHQTRNAQALEKAGAALLIPQSQLTGDLLAKNITLCCKTAPGSRRCPLRQNSLPILMPDARLRKWRPLYQAARSRRRDAASAQIAKLATSNECLPRYNACIL